MLAIADGPNGSGQTLIAVDRTTDGNSIRRLSFANLSAGRTFFSAWRLDTGDIGAEDNAQGGNGLIRIWSADSSFNILAAAAPFSAFAYMTLPSFGRDGKYYAFAGSDGAGTGLYLQAVGAKLHRVADVSGGGLRPMTALDGRTVLRVANGTQIKVFSTNGSSVVVSPAGAADLGPSGGSSLFPVAGEVVRMGRT